MKGKIVDIPFIAIISFFLIFNVAFAETKTFIKEYTYQASEFDSKVSSRTLALEQVKRLLLEELGSYLESNTEVKDFQLTKDKIVALTAGVVHTNILNETWDGKNYWVKAEIKADPENVAKSIDTLRKDQKKSEDLEELRKKSDQSLKEIERLQKEVVSLKNDLKAKETYNKNIATLKEDTGSPKTSQPQVKKKQVATSEYKYYASSKSNKYHYPFCTWAQRISPSNRIAFRSANEARIRGYVPCKVCKPPFAD